jgi:SAM-dependent methyltransferase
MVLTNTLKKLVATVDRSLGRGSYRALRRYLDPHVEYTQITYGRVLDSELTSTARWLDAGCGHEILEHGAGTEQFDLCSKIPFVVGCDLDMASLRRHMVIKNRLCCELGAMPFRSESFDVVSLNNVAEHLSRPALVFGEFSRVLSDGGILVVHTPNARSYWARIVAIGRRILPSKLILRTIRFLEHREEDDVFPTFYRANTKRELLELARATDMRVESLLLLRDRPLFYFFAPLSAVEMLCTRFMAWIGMEEFAAPVLLVVLRRKRRSERPNADEPRRQAVA